MGQDVNMESRDRHTVSLHHWSDNNESDSNTKLIASMREGDIFVDLVSYKGGYMTASIIHLESIVDGVATVQVFVNNVLNLKNCVDVTVVMRDSYGDGWQGNMLFVGEQVVSLADSSSGQVTMCLPFGVYYPYACGGRDPEEVSWDILQGDEVLVSNGQAFSSISYFFKIARPFNVVIDPPNAVTDLTSLMSVQQVWLEGGYTLVGGQEWAKVSTSVSTFTVASVFMSLPTIPGRYTNESFPAIARVRSVIVSEGRVSFETRLYQANDSFCSKQWRVPQPIAPMLLPWLVVQHGAYSVSGHYFMVGSANITKTDNSVSDYNFPRINYYVGCGGSATLCSYPEGSKVGVVLQLQTVVNDRLLIPRCKVVALRFFRAGLQSHDSSDPSYHSIPYPEVLSYMSFPTGIKFYCYEKFSFETTFSTLSSVKQTFNFLQRDGDYLLPALYGTVITATGNNLVAIRPVDQTLESVSLLLQEDQCTKEETVHGAEEVSLLSLVNVYGKFYSTSKCMAVFNSGTFSPTPSPTLRPTLSPTSVPTAFPSYVRCKLYKTPMNVFIQNRQIGVSMNSLTPCACDEAHVLVDMRDSYGDGWNGNTMRLGSESITLSKMSSSQWVGCLSPGSYAPYVCGGRYVEEISWNIFVNGVMVISNGKADSTCSPTSGSFNVTHSPCVYGYTHVVVLMRDAAHDGWNGNRMFIGNETLTLTGGSSGEQGVCLPPGSYSPYVCEGAKLTDVEWDILANGEMVIAGGKADESCSPYSGSFTVGCVSVTIYMADSYGDGWNGNMLYIGSETFTLSKRFEGKETVSLPLGTYSPYVCGGSNDREITWSIMVKGVEIISNGKADDTCSPSSGSFKVYSNTLHMEVMTDVPTTSPTSFPTVVVPSRPVTTLPPTGEPSASAKSLRKHSDALINQTSTLGKTVLYAPELIFVIALFSFSK
jgi:hypothetical protein